MKTEFKRIAGIESIDALRVFNWAIRTIYQNHNGYGIFYEDLRSLFETSCTGLFVDEEIELSFDGDKCGNE